MSQRLSFRMAPQQGNSTGSLYSPEYLAQSRVPQILAGIITPTLLCTVAVFARFYSRGVITRNWGGDDTLIALGWLSVLGLLIANLLLVHHGAGHHIVLMTMEDAIIALQLEYASKILYLLGLTATKLGIAKFYLRIWTDKTSMYFAYIIIAEVLITGIVLETLVIFQCAPISGAWDSNPAHCMPAKYQFFPTMAFNVLGDVLLMAFAIPRILPLKIQRRQKSSLLVVVSLGVLVIISSIMRLLQIMKFNSDSDISWVAPDAMDFTTIEVCTSLFCASAPITRPLIRRIFPRLLSSSMSSEPYSRKQKRVRELLDLGTELQSNITTSNSMIWPENVFDRNGLRREEVLKTDIV